MHILDTTPSSGISFVYNIFSQPLACLFVLFMVSFEEQTVLILIKSTLSIFYFMDFVLGVMSKKDKPEARDGEDAEELEAVGIGHGV